MCVFGAYGERVGSVCMGNCGWCVYGGYYVYGGCMDGVCMGGGRMGCGVCMLGRCGGRYCIHMG